MPRLQFWLRSGLIFLLLLNQPLPAWGWGAKGHKLIAAAAAADLPASLPAFARRPGAALLLLANEPDRWREAGLDALNADNAPNHFIDLERVPFHAAWPRDRYRYMQALDAAAARLRARRHPRQAALLAPQRVGFDPYAAIENYQRLVVAFQEYRAARLRRLPPAPFAAHAIEVMGLLSHYVADGSQPLHTTIQFNGWTGPDPAGYTRSRQIHWRFETLFVNRAIPAGALHGKLAPPQYLAHPFTAYLHFLFATHAQVAPLYQLERQGAFRGRGSAAGRHFVIARLAAGAQMLANLYYSAWRQSARPPRRPFQF